MIDRRIMRGEISPFEDPRIVMRDANKQPLTAGAFARLFSERPPETQEKLAYGCLKRDFDPNMVFAWITDEQVLDKVKIWSIGRGVYTPPPESPDPDHLSEGLLNHDDELIKRLSPHLKQVDLARVITLRKYRDADEDTQHALFCGVYRLMGDYLGPRRYYFRESQSPTLISLPELPAEIFSDQIIKDILFESEREAIMPVFNKNKEEGFKYLEELRNQLQDPNYAEFIDALQKHFSEASEFHVPGFKSQIPGNQKDIVDEEVKYSPFPLFHQQEYAYRFVNKKLGNSDLLIGATRTMKSGGAQLALRAAGSKSAVVICPSGINKLNWERELQEKLVQPANIITIESTAQLRRLAEGNFSTNPDYTIIGYQLLSRLNTQESVELFQKLKAKLGWDGLIADEVHLAKEADAECSQQLYILSRTLPKEAPRIAMTATGIVNTVEDLDSPVRVLLPYDYPQSGDFTRSARNDPHLVAALLHGKQLLTRWSKESTIGHLLPPIEYQEIAVPLSPFHQKLYEFVYMDDTIENQVKRGMLRQVSLEPLLIRRHYRPERIELAIQEQEKRLDSRQDDRNRAITQERIIALQERLHTVLDLSSVDQVHADIREAHEKYLNWIATKDPAAKFDEDFLTMFGYERLALWTFFNLSKGMDELVQKSQDAALMSDWKGKDEIFSSKYFLLKRDIDEDLAAGKKVIVFSGFYQNQVTSGIEDISGDDELAFLSLYDHLRLWYGDDKVLKIDGKVNSEPKSGELADREKVRREWRLNPDKKILLATLRSSRLGIDLSIPPTKANGRITGLSEDFIDLADTYADMDQGEGRGRGPGQLVPVEVKYFKTTNAEYPQTFRYGFIDHGMWEAIEFKRLLSQMVLDGIPLTEDEEKKVQAHMNATKIELFPDTPRGYLFNKFLRKVRGQGLQGNILYMAQKGFEDMTNVDFFSAYYPENDHLTVAGHNARVVSEIIKKHSQNSQIENPKVASIGSGAGILQATMAGPVVNIDMLEEILEISIRRNGYEGGHVVGDASTLPIKPGAFDITDASFMLHWSSNKEIRKEGGDQIKTSERAQILEELNRITSQDGLVVITVPPSHLTKSQFLKWQQVLEEYFGFQLRKDIPSGLITATDFKREQIAWIFNLVKVADPKKQGYEVSDLAFDFEKVSEIVNKTRNGVDGQTISQSVPHTEFEIEDPEDGNVHKIQYQHPSEDKKIEDLILSPQSMALPYDLDILSNQGEQEFGLFRRLTREARNSFSLDTKDAESLAFAALSQWSQSGSQKHHLYRIWSELKIIMNQIQKGGKNVR